MPWPGRHMIELLEDGRIVDQASIEVRGARLRPPAAVPTR